MNAPIATNDTVWGFVGAMTVDELGPWRRYLDDVALAGYAGVEHSPARAQAVSVEMLREELQQRDLKLAGLGLYGALETPDGRQSLAEQLRVAASFATVLAADYLYVIDAMDTDAVTGKIPTPVALDDRAWSLLIDNFQALSDHARNLCGLPLLLHPHEYSHIDSLEQVERFLADTDPARAALLFDTGHCAWRGGDPASFYARHRGRIAQIHLKNVDTGRIPDGPLALQDAVATGAFADLWRGSVAFPALCSVLRDSSYEGWLTVEMLRGAAPGAPREAAAAALRHLRQAGFPG